MNTYITTGWTAIVKELWVQPQNRSFIKPYGGLWACKYTPDSECPSDWIEWCKRENFSTGRLDIGVIFQLTENARIYTIDRYGDLVKLMSKYPEKTIFEIFPTLDFVKLANDYDVIKLTDRGQYATRLSHPFTLYGWDVACILILNFDVIGEQTVYKEVMDGS